MTTTSIKVSEELTMSRGDRALRTEVSWLVSVSPALARRARGQQQGPAGSRVVPSGHPSPLATPLSRVN